MVEPRDFHVILLAAGSSQRLAHLTQHFPKSFLLIRGKRIIDYTLDALHQREFRKVTIVTGYCASQIADAVGTVRGNLRVDYEYNPIFKESSHGWSLFLMRRRWCSERRPVLLLHADTFFDPQVIDALLKSDASGAIAVDECFKVRVDDRPIAYGKGGRLAGIEVGNARRADTVGEVMGVNVWFPSFMERFFYFMDFFFRKEGPNHTWETALTRMILANEGEMAYTLCGQFAWMNINREEDYRLAESLVYPKIYRM